MYGCILVQLFAAVFTYKCKSWFGGRGDEASSSLSGFKVTRRPKTARYERSSKQEELIKNSLSKKVLVIYLSAFRCMNVFCAWYEQKYNSQYKFNTFVIYLAVQQTFIHRPAFKTSQTCNRKFCITTNNCKVDSSEILILKLIKVPCQST